MIPSSLLNGVVLILFISGLTGIVIGTLISTQLKYLLISFFIYLIVETLLNFEGAPIFGSINLSDLYLLLLVIALMNRIIRGGFKKYFEKRLTKIFVIYFLCESVIVIASASTFGVKTLSTYRPSYSFFIFFLVITSYEWDQMYFIYYKKLFIAILLFSTVVFMLRYLGLLSITKHYADSIAISKDYYSWNNVRYLSNIQTLFILFASIVLFLDENIIKSKVVMYFLIMLSTTLIVISTQRMIFVLLIIFIFYYFAKNYGVRSMKLYAPVIFIVIAFMSVSSMYVEMILYSYENIFYDFGNSNGGYRLLDAVYTFMEVYDRNFLYGDLITPTMFARIIKNMTFSYWVHNSFVLSFVQGGIVIFFPMVLFWMESLFRLGLSFRNEKYGNDIKIAFFLVLFIFIFNNTSGAGIYNVIPLSFGFYVLNRPKNLNNLIN